MGVRTGNPAWVDSATEVEAQANPGRKITAAKLNAIEAAIDDSAEAGHQHDARYVRTVNGTGPDGSGNVVVSGGGSATWDTLAGKPAVIAAGDTAAEARTAIGAGTSSFSGDYDDLTGKPTLGTAAATASTDYATAAQGAKADAAIPSGLVDAKGDLIVATGADTVTRLPAGTNGHVLTADSAQASGVKWAAPAGGGGGDPSRAPLRPGWIDFGGPVVNRAIGDPPQDNLFCFVPIWIPWDCLITDMAVQCVTAAADTNTTVRLGLYDTQDYYPGSLVVEASPMTDMSSTGQKVATVTGPVVVPRGAYWTAVHSVGTAAAFPMTSHMVAHTIAGEPVPAGGGDGWRAFGTVSSLGFRTYKSVSEPLPATAPVGMGWQRWCWPAALKVGIPS